MVGASMALVQAQKLGLKQIQAQTLVQCQRIGIAQVLGYSQKGFLEAIKRERESDAHDVLEQVSKGCESPVLSSASTIVGDGYGENAVPQSQSPNLEEWRSTGLDFAYNPDAWDRREYRMSLATKEETLASVLLHKLAMEVPDKPGDQTKEIGEAIIGEIDSRGYFTGDIEIISTKNDVSEKEVERVLRLIQQFAEPTGVGARNNVECLLLQIEEQYPQEYQELKTLLCNHSGDTQLYGIAEAMGITNQRLEELTRLVRTLNLNPGNAYASEPTEYVIPDVIVEEVEGEYMVCFCDNTMPALHVSSHYYELLRSKELNQEEKESIRKAVQSAEWLIERIEMRKRTILNVAKTIVKFQEPFFDRGITAMRPLKLQDVADIVKVDKSTVSRATNGKYMLTPQGLLEMKYFFSDGIRTHTGESISNRAVMDIVRQIIHDEDKTCLLSDEKVTATLNERGISVKRRTVTKYRERLGIPSSRDRRRKGGSTISVRQMKTW